MHDDELSQHALAEQLGSGFSRGIIARWEKHGPPRGRWLGRLVRLAAFFEVSTDAMLGYHPRPRPGAPVIQIGTINFHGGSINFYWGARRNS
ncbi:MAG TPA: helix-turn-helix transcriptional regulator [Chloroflexota bacterium]